MNRNILITILLAITGAGGFFAGMKYKQSQPSTFPRQFQGRQGSEGTDRQLQNRIRMGGGQVIGEIISRDDKSITVKLPDSSSKIVFLSDTTTISKTSEGTKSDLKAGERVSVFGTNNSDGTVTALNIQLNPAFRRSEGGGT